MKDNKTRYTCPTVRIKAPEAPGGFVVINEADFDPEKHEFFVEPKEG